jgi:hypothetical protein
MAAAEMSPHGDHDPKYDGLWAKIREESRKVAASEVRKNLSLYLVQA